MDEVRKVAKEEQTTINQLINVAVAEKLAVLRQQGFEAREKRADPAKALAVLAKLGRGKPPVEEDELDENTY